MRKPLVEKVRCKNCSKIFERLLKARKGRHNLSQYRAMNTVNCSSKCTKEKLK